MSLNLTISTVRMEKMLADIAASIPEILPKAVEEEAKAVLTLAVKYTPAASATKIRQAATKQIERRFNTFAGGDTGRQARGQFPHISITKNGTWWIDQNEQGKRTFYLMTGNRKWSDERWNRFKAEEKDRLADRKVELSAELKRRLGARGLAKRSWHEIGKILGFTIPVPAYAARAVPSTGALVAADFKAMRSRTPTGFTIHLGNALPYIRSVGGEAALRRAMNGRVRQFEVALQKATGDRLAVIKRRYG